VLLSVKLCVRDGRTVRLLDKVFNERTDGQTDSHESQRRRHGVTAAIAVDAVAVRVCPSARPFVSNSIKETAGRKIAENS